ncbi:MAG: hypothetical protein ACRDYA_06450 [Egibacteraceae bacterium]
MEGLEELRSNLATVTAEMGDLRRRAELNDKQIDALQLEANKKKRWWGDPVAVVSALALVLSLFATAMTQYDKRQERQLEARNRLTSLVQQLTNISLQRQELLAQYGPGKAPVVTTEEVLLLASQAANLLESRQVSAAGAEYGLVAFALVNAGEFGRAKDLLSAARKLPQGLQEKVIVLRVVGIISFAENNIDEGRRAFEEAVNIFEQPQYSGTAEVVKNDTNYATELRWANAELSAGECIAAGRHLDKTKEHHSRLPVNPQRQVLLDDSYQQLNSCYSKNG